MTGGEFVSDVTQNTVIGVIRIVLACVGYVLGCQGDAVFVKAADRAEVQTGLNNENTGAFVFQAFCLSVAEHVVVVTVFGVQHRGHLNNPNPDAARVFNSSHGRHAIRYGGHSDSQFI